MSGKLKRTSKAGAGNPRVNSPVTKQSVTPAGEVKEMTSQKEAKPVFITHEEAERWVQDIMSQVRSYSNKGRARAEKTILELTQKIANLHQADPRPTLARPASQNAQTDYSQQAQKEINHVQNIPVQ
jgi:polyhydroxyalkanoate synthesis regulator phasin